MMEINTFSFVFSCDVSEIEDTNKQIVYENLMFFLSTLEV